MTKKGNVAQVEFYNIDEVFVAIVPIVVVVVVVVLVVVVLVLLFTFS